MSFTTRILVFLCALATAPAIAAQPALETEEQKTVYALGLAIAQSLASFSLSEAELEILTAGISDGVHGREPKIDFQAYQQQVQALAATRASAAARAEKDASAALLEEMAGMDGAERTASGLIYIEVAEGAGESPAPTDVVQVHYHGTLRDGSVFDSSVQRGAPVNFAVNQVIPCWTEGLQKMKVGGKSKLVCPSGIAYGDRGRPPTIKPGATLVFEVELLTIEEPPGLE